MAEEDTPAARRKFFVAATLSFAAFALGAVIVVGDYNADLQKAACGRIGLILGYWLS